MTDTSPYAADTRSVDATINALYETISGPAGPRNWERDRHLFHPSARLMRGSPEEPGTLTVFTLDQFIEYCRHRLGSEDFYEWEIGRDEFRFGRWVHAVSAYESRRGYHAPPYARGINSIQLWFEHDRWWIVNLVWDWERPDRPIPHHLEGPPRRVAAVTSPA